MALQIGKETVIQLAETLQDYKAMEVKAYDVSKVVDYTDFVIVVSSNSSPHSKALFQQVHDYFKNLGVEAYVKHKRLEQRQWIVCDYFELVVHILQEEERAYYKLDDLFEKGGLIYPMIKC